MFSPSEDDVLFFEAASSGNLELLKELAAKSGDLEVFRHRAEILKDCEGGTILHYAAENGKIHICKYLIEQVKVEIDIKTEKGDTPLLFAVIEEHISTAKYLIIRGANIAMSDSTGATPLHYAAGIGNQELMKLLLSKGADIEGKSVDGTPLQFAASHGNVDSVQFLINHGANPNSVSPLSLSPLVSAIASRSFECFELLLRAGADPNLNTFGTNPLVYAAKESEAKFVLSLLEAGANPNLVDTACLTPIEYAALAGRHEVVRILLPVTNNISCFPDWSFDGIMNYIHSERAKGQRNRMRNRFLKLMKLNGKNAFVKEDFSNAIKWYNEAIYLEPSDLDLLLNRSRCWVHLDEAAYALHDAETCVRLNPDWPLAHYIEGVAWKLFENLTMSSIAFGKAGKLAPREAIFADAFRHTSCLAFMEFAAKHPLEALRILEATDNR